MSEPAFEGFPAFVQVCLPAPAADVIQRGLRMAHESLSDELYRMVGDGTKEPDKLLEAEYRKIQGQFDLLAEFFDDVAINPQGYPVRGGMAASIKRRQRQWQATQPKRPRRKKGQSRRAYEARVARWGVKRQEEVAAYNAAAESLILADLPVTQVLVDALVAGTTIEEIQEAIETQQAEIEFQERKYAAAMAALEAEEEIQDGAPEIVIPPSEKPGIILPAGVDGG